jgi:hypothetical protein
LKKNAENTFLCRVYVFRKRKSTRSKKKATGDKKRKRKSAFCALSPVIFQCYLWLILVYRNSLFLIPFYHFFYCLFLTCNFYRNKLHLQHNTKEDIKENEGEEGGKEDEAFFDVEMTIDEELFYEDVGAITEGTFVSFKYVGEYSKGLGRPMNPRVSKNRRGEER